MAVTRSFVLALLVLVAPASAGLSVAEVSPVQKVVQLLEECKAKVQKDLDAEAKQMEEYSTMCDDELKDKAYAIKTADRAIQDSTAEVEDATATIAELEDEIVMLGTELAEKDKELSKANTVRATNQEAFAASEKEMVLSVDELMRAVETLKAGHAASFVQVGSGKKFGPMVAALKQIVEAGSLDAASKRKLQSFVQEAQAAEEDDDLSFKEAPKAAAFESKAGGILQTMEDMQEKAETTLSDLRKKETEEVHSHELIVSGLEDEISNGKDKLADATQSKAEATQDKGKAEAELAETKKTKAADEEYSATLKSECEMTAKAWEERQKSATEEMGAIDKAKEILVSGVKASFVEVGVVSTRKYYGESDESEEDDRTSVARGQVVDVLQRLGRKHHSFALAQLASMAKSDPFGKVRGLIEDMMTKLITEANEDATHEAFCQEEMGKSKKSAAEKTDTMEKYQNRIETAESTIAQLTEAIKTLEAEIAEIDAATAEATEIRNSEKAEFLVASKDFRDSAEAVARAIEVLKGFYEGALVQVSSSSNGQQPAFGSAKGDTAHTIISVLEMSEEDFTRLLAESESAEEEAAKAYEKLSQENKVSKASKEAESKAKASEVKSLTVELENSKEDHASVKEELDAVNDYLAKLKPECESKAMSYEERKAAREAEIEGLKEALSILSGDGLALVQTARHLRAVRRA